MSERFRRIGRLKALLRLERENAPPERLHINSLGIDVKRGQKGIPIPEHFLVGPVGKDEAPICKFRTGYVVAQLTSKGWDATVVCNGAKTPGRKCSAEFK